MIVSMWMTRELITIGPDAPIAEAAALMAHHRIRRLLVAESHAGEPRLLGIVSAGDILHAFPPDVNPFAVLVRKTSQDHIATREIMKSDLLTVMPDTPIEEAALLMRDRKIGALPVVREGKLLGIITESDIFRAFVALFSSPEAGARITFAIAKDKDEDAFGLVAGLTAGHAVRVLSLFTSVEGDTPACVVRLAGADIPAVLEAIWKSHHRVLNVLHLAEPS
jgi:acetoin utilization protein AcuB